MPCMCGDLCCSSCGPAQGNYKCEHCGNWAAEGCKPNCINMYFSDGTPVEIYEKFEGITDERTTSNSSIS
jgi:hypothetical protein